MTETLDVDHIDKLNNAKYKLHVISLAMSGKDDITEQCKNGIALILWEVIEIIEEIVDKADQKGIS